MAFQLEGNIQVQNNTRNRFTEPQLTTNNAQLPHTQTVLTVVNADMTQIDDSDQKSAYIRTGYIIKHHIYPKHKFITKYEDLSYDNSPDGKSICKTYLRALDLGDSSDEEKCRRLWENARNSIPLSLNT